MHGHTWEEFVDTFMPNIWGPVVKLCHLELTRSDLICKTSIRDVIKIISRWKMEDVSIPWLIQEYSYLLEW